MTGRRTRQRQGVAGADFVTGRLARHLRGHLLRFEGRPSLDAEAAVGARALVIATAVAVEAVRLVFVSGAPVAVPRWMALPALVVLVLAAVRVVLRLSFAQFGLQAWRDWSTTERSYLVQVVVIANVVFPLVLAGSLRHRLAGPDVVSTLWHVFMPYLVFGFYQELVYRGLVQRELVRRWGSRTGIAAATALYTFGPLHASYFGSPVSVAGPMFVGIFAIGLFFGLLFTRSGNLWLPAIMHGIGNAYLAGSLAATR